MDNIEINNKIVYFSKLRDDAQIPSKRNSDAGFDIYSCFDKDYMAISPHKTEMIPTGIASAFSNEYVFILKERGSTGTKGIGQRAGIVDSNYRGEWFVPITNHNDIPLVISKLSKEKTETAILKEAGYNKIIYYSYEKAICQALLLPVPKVGIIEIAYDHLINIESDRGTGMMGSSGK